MARDYLKTDTMRIKISGQDLHTPKSEEVELSGLDLINNESVIVEQNRPAANYERDFNELLESAYDAVIVTDTEGKFIKFNNRAEEYLLYDKLRMFQLNIVDIISGSDKKTLKTIFETLKNEQRIFIEAFCKRKDGTTFPAEVTASIMHLFDNEQICFFIRNVTVRVETEKALQNAQSELLKSAHLAGMAEIATGVLHDVGNILNSINVSCELIHENLDKSSISILLKANKLMEEQDDISEFIKNNPRGKKLPNLISHISKSLSKERKSITQEAENLTNKIQMVKDVISTQQTYAKTGLYEEEANIEDLVEDALAILRSQIDKEDLTLTKDFKQIPPVMLQKSKFVHITLNIIKNAIEAMGTMSNPKIELIINSDKENAKLTIKDNGQGISPANLKKVFEHGFTTKKTGHGFGLHACSNLMTEMGGSLTVTSKGEGKGATFVLSLPLHR